MAYSKDKSKVSAAARAAATRGRSRQFADRADILEKLGRRDADAEIDLGVEDWRKAKVEADADAECAEAR